MKHLHHHKKGGEFPDGVLPHFDRFSTAFRPMGVLGVHRRSKADCRNSHKNNARRLAMQRLQLTYKRGDRRRSEASRLLGFVKVRAYFGALTLSFPIRSSMAKAQWDAWDTTKGRDREISQPRLKIILFFYAVLTSQILGNPKVSGFLIGNFAKDSFKAIALFGSKIANYWAFLILEPARLVAGSNFSPSTLFHEFREALSAVSSPTFPPCPKPSA